MGRTIGVLITALAMATGAARADTPLTTVRITDGLVRPVGVSHAPGDSDRLFVLELRGRIVVVKNGAPLATPFLDVDPLASFGPEAGLLGLAFHPNYAENGTFYIDYTANDNAVVIARYTVSSDPDRANLDGDIVMTIPQPDTNHNGGWIEFGPDGFLYIATGDGGGHEDPNNRAQDIDQLYGKILRIDVDGDDLPGDDARDYAIPKDNPFVDGPGADEIWVYGLRNPWRNAFDALTGDLYIADVGESDWEEIDFLAAGAAGGANFGWRCMEGNACTGFGGCTCFADTLTPPIHEYSHDAVGRPCSIIGGEVYRGCAIPDLAGAYFFGDYCTGQIWSLRYDGAAAESVVDRTAELVPQGGLHIDEITAFGRDGAGEIYICDRADGELYKIVPATAVTPGSVVDSRPPDGAIDARQPHALDNAKPTGWEAIELVFDGPTPCPATTGFAVAQADESGDPPVVVAVERLAADRVRVRFDRPVSPKMWTTVTHLDDGASVRIGFLPADVNGNGVSDTADVASLIGVVQGLSPPGAIWMSDVDRSGASAPADVLRAVDLLLGAGSFDAYDGAALP